MDLTVTRNSDRSSDYYSSKNMAFLFWKENFWQIKHDVSHLSKTKQSKNNWLSTRHANSRYIQVFKVAYIHMYICI